MLVILFVPASNFVRFVSPDSGLISLISFLYKYNISRFVRPDSGLISLIRFSCKYNLLRNSNFSIPDILIMFLLLRFSSVIVFKLVCVISIAYVVSSLPSNLLPNFVTIALYNFSS